MNSLPTQLEKTPIIEDLEKLIGSAALEVFSTMLSIDLSPCSPDVNAATGEIHIASSVGFIGKLTGVVYLYSTNSLARRLTRSLLGMAPTEAVGNEMVNDAMGELTNMVVGHLKSRLSDRGMPCVLTIPSIVRGNQFCIEPVSSTERRVFAFRCEAHQLVVEVLLKPCSPQS
jgi:chemotaxis protein CheX